MPSQERAARERAKKAAKVADTPLPPAPPAVVEARRRPAKPKAPAPVIVTTDDIRAEHAAMQAACEQLRPLSQGARYRAIEWLRSWVNQEATPADYPF